MVSSLSFSLNIFIILQNLFLLRLLNRTLPYIYEFNYHESHTRTDSNYLMTYLLTWPPGHWAVSIFSIASIVQTILQTTDYTVHHQDCILRAPGLVYSSIVRIRVVMARNQFRATLSINIKSHSHTCQT